MKINTTNTGDSTPRLWTVAEYRAAIVSLNDATNAIDGHVNASRKVLEASKRQLQTRTNAQVTPVQGDNLTQKKELSLSIEASLRETTDRNTEFCRALQKSVAALSIATDDTLTRHDHKFKQLNHDHSSKNDSHLNDRDERVSRLLEALQRTQGQAIHARLSRTYLQALNSTVLGNNDQVNASIDAKVRLVQTDLSTLYADINDVATMVVAYEHGDKLNAVLHKVTQNRLHLGNSAARSSLEQLVDMNEQLEHLVSQAELLESHRILQQHLADHLSTIQPDSASRQQSSAKQYASNQPQRATSSLNALKQCLGLDGVQQDAKRAERIDAIFSDFTQQIDLSMAIQSERLGHVIPTGGHLSAVDVRPKQEKMLDELDNLISDTKTKIDDILR